MELKENKLVSINILTWNGENYIEDCLKSVFNQTYKNVEILVVDNASTDKTVEIIRKIRMNSDIGIAINKKNIGFAAGHNLGIRNSKGEYILCLNQDVILHKDFVKNAVQIMEQNEKIGSVQGKIYQLNKGKKTNIIDTLGFEIFKSGEMIDVKQGQKDDPGMNPGLRIFGVNGVAPLYRQNALNDVELNKEYFDQDFFCYTEDIDLAWRMRWRGWKAVLCPKAILWHDRTSAKKLGKGYSDFIKLRKQQSFFIRKMGWRNQWLLFIKNQSFSNAIKFFPKFFLRQTKLFLYLLIFETRVIFSSVFEIIPLIPKMLKKRKTIMKTRKISNKEIGKWFK